MVGTRTIHLGLALLLAGLAAADARAARKAPVAGENSGPLWSFAPPQAQPVPRVADAAWPRTALDSFVLARIEAAGLKPAAPADRRTLIRRATFDLIGLPPTPDEVDAFVNDPDPEAYAKLIERLLASPHYGERWGRHWLDVVRYADSNGLDENVAYGTAWRYRDYVIAAFNRDKPYDQFVREQVAGDLLAPLENSPARHEMLTATGFLSLGPKVLAEPDKTKMLMDIVDEQLDTLGRAVMGLTIGCARCHDHKFDPISHEDYYALAGIFTSTRTMDNFVTIARWHENGVGSDLEMSAKAAHDRKVAEAEAQEQALVEAANEALRAASKPPGTLPRDPEPKYPDETRAKLAAARAAVVAVQAKGPDIPTALGVREGKVADTALLVRGDHTTPSDVVPRRFPTAIAGDAQPQLSLGQSGRLELAHWLTKPDHPLTARVMVNRIWRWHFGRGLVRTADNFGRLGEEPDNPALLDWLARRFVESGWSVKAMHRLIMSSATYQMSAAAPDERLAQLDPENRLQTHAELRRVEGETLRDALLAVSGMLDRTTAGGPAITHVKNREFLFDHTSKDGTTYGSRRRSVYLPIVRNNLYDVFQLFDCPDAAVPNGDRATTTVPPQALFFMNADLVLDASEALANALLALPNVDDAARVRELHRRAFGRSASDAEVARSLALVTDLDNETRETEPDAARRRGRAWSWLCQTVLASNEFVYVN
jgi:hypothetical protein